MLCGLGYGNLAHLVNDPRVDPRAWQEGNDVELVAGPDVAASGGAAVAVQQPQQLAPGSVAGGGTAAAAAAVEAPQRLGQEPNVAVGVSATSPCAHPGWPRWP